MAVLWSRSSGGWDAALLGSRSVALPGRAVLFPSDSESVSWVLFGGDSLPPLVNGEPLSTGIRVLRDRDEIRLPTGERLFFSTERLAEVVVWSGADPVRCARCQQTIRPGAGAVRCPSPRCGHWHHQEGDGGYDCWTYGEVCARCDQPTDLEHRTFRWSPGAL